MSNRPDSKLPTTEQEYREILAALPEEHRESYERLVGTLKPWEKLHPELQKWIVDEGPFGPSIKHPLVYDIIYAPGMRDGQLNDIYEAKTKALTSYAESGSWNSYVFTHERPWRLHALVTIQHEIEDDCQFWDLVGNVWTDTENAWQNYDEWDDVFRADRTCRESMMDEAEQKALVAMSEEITIFRGYNADEDDERHSTGFSWTIERERAEWFANRFASHRGTAYVATGTVSKQDVLAHFLGRGEAEIVALPEHIIVTDREAV